MRRALLACGLLLLGCLPAARAQGTAPIFTGDGHPATLDAIVEAAAQADVVFLGEQHDDSLGHALQAELLRRIHARHGAMRYVTLSLEMFETDVQTVLDEYLAGFITEAHFLRASRPWDNYARDYRPMVEYAKAHALPVVAANAPRRYVNRVSRRGPASLDSLWADVKAAYLAPLPYPMPTPAYRAKWDALMGGGAAHGAAAAGPSNALMAQALWDATMAHRIAGALARVPNALVVHPVGAFHVERNVGTPDALRHYRPRVRALIVTMRPDAAWNADAHAGLGDFVVLTGR
jgi:uncharacterized iron-regulated protein